MSESYASNPALALALRRGRLSDQLLADSLKPRPVGGHAGGLAQMGTALIGGVMAGLDDRRIDRLLREDRETADAQIAALYGRGPAPAAPSGPAPVAPGSLPPPIPNPEMTGQPAPAGGTAMPVAAPAQPPAQIPEPPAPRMVRLANGQEINLDVLQNAEASPNQRVRLAAAGVRRSIDDDRAERRFQQQIALQRDAAGRATAAAGRESFGQPTEMTDANGQRVMVQVGNRGTIRPVQGYSAPPAAPPRETMASLTPANASALLADLAPGYEAGTLTPEQERRFEMAYSISQRPQSYFDQESGRAVTVPALTMPDYVQRALAAGQLRRAGGGATVPAAAPGLPMPDMAAPAPMVQGPRAGMAPPVMPQEMPAPAAPITPPAAPGVMPRAGDATAMPPMVGEQGRIPLATGGNMTVTQVRPERPSSQATEAARTAVVGTGRVLDAINNFRQALEPFRGRTGLQAFNPRDAEGQRLTSAYELLKMAMRDESLLNTGVLQPGENVMIEQMLRSPSSITGVLTNMDAYNAMLDEFAGFATRGANRVRASAGMPELDWTAPRTGVTPDPRNVPPGGAAPSQIIVNPQTGQRMQLRGGQWVPMQ
jgi:hypothetical protein